MANGIFLIITCIVVTTLAFPHPAEDIITQPKPGEEYVFVQTTGIGARPIARKDKHSNEERPFETSHKFPASLTYALNQNESDEDKTSTKGKLHKREAPAPPPAGAIKINVQQLLEKYKSDIKTSTTQAPKVTTRKRPSKRTKKEAKQGFVEVTSSRPILTTAASAPKKIDDDVSFVASGSEKQRSRIQIKKAPNGQEYEYEYVYYYYDDDNDSKVTNSHDGPAREDLPQGTSTKGSIKSRGNTERTSAAPEANEVVPSSRAKTRGRQLGEEEVGEERLPANTRFPPRSRNLNTTPLPEEEPKATRGRGRGRPTTEASPSAATEADNVSDETQGSRGRTRANVRRPSLELVDNASFNTHPGSEPASSPSFPTDLPAGPEPVRLPENSSETKKHEAVTETTDEDGTTAMSAMDKVALDLYAILQGTQKLSGDDPDDNSTDTDSELTTAEGTTEQAVETTTPTTTTTTTTTPTPTTTTTTTEAALLGRNRFKGRGRKTTHAPSSTTEAEPTETKPKSKFNRPSFGGRHRPSARTTTESSIEHEASKEEAKPVSHSRPTLSRSRFGATRTRTRTTAAPSENAEDSSSSTSAPVSRPSLTRPRATFNLRTRGRSTTPATDKESDNDETAVSETTSTTARSRRIQAGAGVRPLRPGPRINLARGRPGQSTTTTTEAPLEEGPTDGSEPAKNDKGDASEEKEVEPSATPVDNSPLGRLKNKHRVNVQSRPKAAASTPVHVRRVNPLIARRKPAQHVEATSSEAPQESVRTEAPAEAEESEETESPAAVSSTTTTEEPRGLNKLLAGRRRLATRPASHN